MKTKILLKTFLFLQITTFSQEQVANKFDVSQVSFIAWNSKVGLPYAQVPGANLGATSFELISQNQIAFLNNASNEIIITDINSGKLAKKFSIINDPRDFTYEMGLFYVLFENNVIVYDTSGILKHQFSFPKHYNGRAARLTRFENSTYLLLSSGNSLKIETARTNTIVQEYEGWITIRGLFVKTQVNGNSYSVKVIDKSGKNFQKTFVTDKKAAGIFIVGISKNNLVLDVQTFISENPVQIDRHIVSVELKTSEVGSAIASINVPEIYYVLSNKDFSVSPDGRILNMLTSPNGTYIFSLLDSKNRSSKGYPASLTMTKYHFNNNLLKVDKK